MHVKNFYYIYRRHDHCRKKLNVGSTSVRTYSLLSFGGRKGIALLRHRIIQNMKNMISYFTNPWSSVSWRQSLELLLTLDLE